MKRLPLFACLLLFAAPAVAEDKFFFQKGDRIVFLGDSITEQYQYSNDIELYLTTRFPEWKLFFLNRELVERFFFEGNQHELLEYQSAGTVTRLTFPASTLGEYANVLAQKSH